MGIADEILRKGFKIAPKATPPQESVADGVLDASAEALRIAGDQQPAIGALEHPHVRRGQIVHVDNLPASQPVTVSGVVSENLAQQAGVALSAPTADAPTGTEVAPVVRDIFRKRQILLTSTPLGGAGVFTSPWFDSELTGDVVLRVSASSNIAGASVLLVESEDQVNSVTVASQSQATLTYTIMGFIRARYWRVVYTNAAGAQATFSLYATASNFGVASTVYTGNQAEGLTVFTGGGGAGTFSDGGTIASKASFQNQGQSADKQAIVAHKFNGSTIDRDRNNVNTATGDTGAKVATFNGATQTNFEHIGAFITILLGAVSGTTPTLSAQLQWSPDGGTTWLNLGAALPNLTTANQTGLIAVFPTIGAALTTGASVQVLTACPLPRTWRIVYTIAGTTPSFAISSVQVNYVGK